MRPSSAATVATGAAWRVRFVACAFRSRGGGRAEEGLLDEHVNSVSQGGKLVSNSRFVQHPWARYPGRSALGRKTRRTSRSFALAISATFDRGTFLPSSRKRTPPLIRAQWHCARRTGHARGGMHARAPRELQGRRTALRTCTASPLCNGDRLTSRAAGSPPGRWRRTTSAQVTCIASSKARAPRLSRSVLSASVRARSLPRPSRTSPPRKSRPITGAIVLRCTTGRATKSSNAITEWSKAAPSKTSLSLRRANSRSTAATRSRGCNGDQPILAAPSCAPTKSG